MTSVERRTRYKTPVPFAQYAPQTGYGPSQHYSLAQDAPPLPRKRSVPQGSKVNAMPMGLDASRLARKMQLLSEKEDDRLDAHGSAHAVIATDSWLPYARPVKAAPIQLSSSDNEDYSDEDTSPDSGDSRSIAPTYKSISSSSGATIKPYYSNSSSSPGDNVRRQHRSRLSREWSRVQHDMSPPPILTRKHSPLKEWQVKDSFKDPDMYNGREVADRTFSRKTTGKARSRPRLPERATSDDSVPKRRPGHRKGVSFSDSDTSNSPALPERMVLSADGAPILMKRQGSVMVENVEGVNMDAKPSSKAQEDLPIPEAEARDIRKIPSENSFLAAREEEYQQEQGQLTYEPEYNRNVRNLASPPPGFTTDGKDHVRRINAKPVQKSLIKTFKDGYSRARPKDEYDPNKKLRGILRPSSVVASSRPTVGEIAPRNYSRFHRMSPVESRHSIDSNRHPDDIYDEAPTPRPRSRASSLHTPPKHTPTHSSTSSLSLEDSLTKPGALDRMLEDLKFNAHHSLQSVKEDKHKEKAAAEARGFRLPSREIAVDGVGNGAIKITDEMGRTSRIEPVGRDFGCDDSDLDHRLDMLNERLMYAGGETIRPTTAMRV